MATPNYGFQTINGTDSVDIVNAVNTPITQIDTALKTTNDNVAKIVVPDYTLHKGIKVLVFGDSTFITNSPSVVDQLASLDSTITIKNYAVGGSTYKQVSSQLSSAVTAGDAADADYIIVASGTNDWQSALRLIHVAQGDDAFISKVRDVCDAISKQAPNAQVLLVGAGWASNAKYNGQITLNDCGCTISAYNDIIEGVAGEFNFGCLRLDRLLSINSNNYLTKMLTSNSDGLHPDWDGIYVHYTSKTATHIARLILASIYGANANTAPNSFIDITPPSWKHGKYNNYYYAGIANSVGPLVASNLQANTTYWVTALGGATVVTNNGTLVATSSASQGIMQFPVTTNSNGELNLVMTLPTSDSGQTTLFSPMLSVGRPSVLALNTHAIDSLGDKVVGAQLGAARFLFWSPDATANAAVTIPTAHAAQFSTKLYDLPTDAKIQNGSGVLNFVIPDIDYYSVGIRAANGSVYMSSSIDIENAVNGITSAQLILIGNAS